jgi:hypothetical protein
MTVADAVGWSLLVVTSIIDIWIHGQLLLMQLLLMGMVLLLARISSS